MKERGWKQCRALDLVLYGCKTPWVGLTPDATSPTTLWELKHQEQFKFLAKYYLEVSEKDRKTVQIEKFFAQYDSLNNLFLNFGAKKKTK